MSANPASSGLLLLGLLAVHLLVERQPGVQLFEERLVVFRRKVVNYTSDHRDCQQGGARQSSRTDDLWQRIVVRFLGRLIRCRHFRVVVVIQGGLTWLLLLAVLALGTLAAALALASAAEAAQVASELGRDRVLPRRHRHKAQRLRSTSTT